MGGRGWTAGRHLCQAQGVKISMGLIFDEHMEGRQHFGVKFGLQSSTDVKGDRVLGDNAILIDARK